MGRPRKVFLNRHVLFITSSVEEDLLFLGNQLINTILLGILARAQTLHPVKICHFLFQATHFHLLLVVDNPDDVHDFMERVKTESAHAVNRLLGRRKRTVWCSGYDSPVVLTAEKTIEKIVYIYTNPAKDNVENAIERFPGLSSWRMYKNQNTNIACPWIRREAIFSITGVSPANYGRVANLLVRDSKESHTLILSPDAWLDCFGIYDPQERGACNRRILAGINTKEAELARVRSAQGKKAIGIEKLLSTPIGTRYRPIRDGRRMWCLSDDVELRIGFIQFIKRLIEQAEAAWTEWKKGNIVPYPLGLLAPSLPRLANTLPRTALP